MMWVVLFLIWYLPLVVFWMVPLYQKRNKASQYVSPKNSFSIIIVHRKEENLPQLLANLEAINYPRDLWEIILIEDGNQITPNLPPISVNHHYISAELNSASPKKEAITKGVQLAKNDWILTTDADVVLQNSWLQAFDHHLQQFSNSILVAGPVLIVAKNNFWNQYQQWDFISLQSMTMAGFYWNKPLMCNGANLCFSKSFFLKHHGYQGSEHLASGDDVFLLFKALEKHPKQTHFLSDSNALVQTFAVKNWKKILPQRTRWASKTKLYQNWFPKAVGWHLVITQIMFWVAFFLFLVNYQFQWLGILFLKFVIDGWLQRKSAQFWKQSPNNFFLSWCCYPLITLSVFVLAARGKYTWKGRNYQT